MKTNYPASLPLALLATAACLAADTSAEVPVAGKPTYSYATNGVRDNIQRGGPGKWKLLLDESNVGGKELEAGELVLAAGTESPSHTHA